LTDEFSDKTPKPNLEPGSVEIHIHPPTVQLGQPFLLEVVLKHPENFRFELSALPHNPRFDILSKTRQREEGPQDSTTTFSLQMAAFELGTLKLPSFQFEVTTPEQVGSFALPDKTISVVTSRAEAPSALEDVRPPAPVFVPSYALLYAGAVVLAMALAFVAIWKWMHRKKQEAPLQPVSKPLAERAREALNALRAQALPAQGKTREYYFMLSEIIRGYIGELYQFDALECTTTELIASLQKLHSTQLPIDALAQFSRESDFVKYAKENADIAKCETDLEFAYHLIDKTAPIDVLPARHAQPSLP
jgi:hypothetical protein